MIEFEQLAELMHQGLGVYVNVELVSFMFSHVMLGFIKKMNRPLNLGGAILKVLYF